mmetsp:Transcript_27200/g.24087  ORF Transcript_27200/g.24087 Transcript_27200/m.24087 type:complete len:291 (+) Transcript_27200:38-910(+)
MNKRIGKAPLPRIHKANQEKVNDIEKLRYEKVSYRQKGKNKAGKLLKGNISNSYAKIANPSVPSKFETQLFDNNQENKAFGSKSIRFFEYVNEDPGPGSYTHAQSTSLMGKKKQSFSKKGFGNGFISKVERFNSEIDFQGYFIPDPRAMSSSLPSTRDDSQIQQQQSEKKAKVDPSSFAFKAEGRTEKANKNIVPGPGAYNIQKPMKRSLSVAQPSSVFKSGVDKLRDLKPRHSGPSVGQYDVNADNMLCKAESTFNILKRTANFVDPLNCKRVKVDLYDPFKHVEDDSK